jgi:periplasmic protein TonB
MRSLPASLHPSGVALRQLRKSPSRDLDNGDASADRSASAILGVGHFTVPEDVIVEGPAGSPESSTIRTIVVPHGITAVPRRSPIKARKCTPWHSSPDAHGVVAPVGEREWFTDRLFVESKQTHLPAACTTSAMVHGVIVILVLLLLVARAPRVDLTPRTRMDVSLRMPAILSLPLPAVPPPPARTSVERPSPAPHTPRQAPPSAPASEIRAAAPLETPPSIEPEPQRLDEPVREGAVAVAVGAAAGAAVGGVAGGTGSGPSVEAAIAPTEANRPFRVGDGIARPRKIKDVAPVYPLPALAAQVVGSVLIEATIGADGKVHDPRVIRSIAALDRAALNAVRQWEFEPSRINGVAVAVTMVIVVTFSLQ